MGPDSPTGYGPPATLPALRLSLSIEHCTAPRPTASLKGSSAKYVELASALEQGLHACLPSGVCLITFINTMARRVVPATCGSSVHHRAPPSLPAGGGVAPRVGAFEVSYTIQDDMGVVLDGGAAFSKLQTQRWPNIPALAKRLSERAAQSLDPSATAVVGGIAWSVQSGVGAVPSMHAAGSYRRAPSLAKEHARGLVKVPHQAAAAMLAQKLAPAMTMMHHHRCAPPPPPTTVHHRPPPEAPPPHRTPPPLLQRYTRPAPKAPPTDVRLGVSDSSGGDADDCEETTARTGAAMAAGSTADHQGDQHIDTTKDAAAAVTASNASSTPADSADSKAYARLRAGLAHSTISAIRRPSQYSQPTHHYAASSQPAHHHAASVGAAKYNARSHQPGHSCSDGSFGQATPSSNAAAAALVERLQAAGGGRGLGLTRKAQPPPWNSSGLAKSVRVVRPIEDSTRQVGPRRFVSENPIVTKLLLERGWVDHGTSTSGRGATLGGAMGAGVLSCALVWRVRAADPTEVRLLPPTTLFNHFDSPSALTTKVGLSSSLRAAPPMRLSAPSERHRGSKEGMDAAGVSVEDDLLWTHADLHPRSYDLSDANGVRAFAADVRLTAACSALERFVARAHGTSQNEDTFSVPWCDHGGAHAHSAFVSDGLAAAAAVHVLDRMSQRKRRACAVRGLDLLAFPPPTSNELHDLCATADLDALHGGGARGGEQPGPQSHRPPPPLVRTGGRRAPTSHHDSGEMRPRLVQLASALLREVRSALPQHAHIDGTANIWILKPSYGSKGRGIQIIAGAAGLRQVQRLRGAARVAQKYIERPLLLSGGRKFDVRLYVLQCGWAPGSVWMYSGMLLKLCSAPFALKSSSLANPLAHLTNCAVQKGAPPGAGPEAADLLWSSARFEQWLLANGYGEGAWAERVFPAIAQVARATFAAQPTAPAPTTASHQLEGGQRAASFEVFGLDVLLDESLRPWLLEVNASPNLRDHGAQTLERMLNGVLDIVLGGDAHEDGVARREEQEPGDRWLLVSD